MKPRSTRWTLFPLILALSLMLAAVAVIAQSPVASAHAKYTSSSPAADSTVTEAPTVVTVHFAEEVNPQGSALAVYDTHGKVVSTGAGAVDTSDAKTMTIPMKGDDSESYMVVWHTVSLDDGDPAIGAFEFNVGSPAKPGDTGGSTTSPGSSPAASTSSGIPGWVVALVGIIGLVVGAGGTVLVAGRKPA